jgi:hypothetical protein
VVEDPKVAAADALEEMRRDSDAILATTARLLKHLEELLEASRRQLAAQEGFARAKAALHRKIWMTSA